MTEEAICNVIAFDDGAQAALMALGSGEAVALAGSLKVGVWQAQDGTTRPSLDLTAAQVLTSYHVTRKRKAMQPTDQDGRHEQRPTHDAWKAAAPADRHQRPKHHAPADDDGADLPF